MNQDGFGFHVCIRSAIGDAARKIILESLRFGSFTLSTGGQSHYYFELEGLFSDLSKLTPIARCIYNNVGVPHDGELILAGPAMGALPLLYQAHLLNERHPHVEAKIISVFKNGEIRRPKILSMYSPVVLIDDVFSTGASLYRTMTACMTLGLYNFQEALVVVTRNMDAARKFSSLMHLFSLFAADDLVREGV